MQNYAELSRAYAASLAADEKWAKEIRAQATQLANSVSERYSPPKDRWHHESGAVGGRYVHLFALDRGPQAATAFLPNECFAEGYVLQFGLAVVLEADANTFPKRNYWRAVAAQFQDGACRFRSLDQAGKELMDEPWLGVDEYADLMLSKIAAYLDFDPFTGPRPAHAMGFISVDTK